MHKTRPFLFTLLILLVLDLLVFFTDIPSSSKRGNKTCFEQRMEQVLEGLCEMEEEIEEETESLCAGLLSSRSNRIDFPCSCSRRLLFAQASDAAPLAIGWSMPLLI